MSSREKINPEIIAAEFKSLGLSFKAKQNEYLQIHVGGVTSGMSKMQSEVWQKLNPREFAEVLLADELVQEDVQQGIEKFNKLFNEAIQELSKDKPQDMTDLYQLAKEHNIFFDKYLADGAKLAMQGKRLPKDKRSLLIRKKWDTMAFWFDWISKNELELWEQKLKSFGLLK